MKVKKKLFFGNHYIKFVLVQIVPTMRAFYGDGAGEFLDILTKIIICGRTS